MVAKNKIKTNFCKALQGPQFANVCLEGKKCHLFYNKNDLIFLKQDKRFVSNLLKRLKIKLKLKIQV